MKLMFRPKKKNLMTNVVEFFFGIGVKCKFFVEKCVYLVLIFFWGGGFFDNLLTILAIILGCFVGLTSFNWGNNFGLNLDSVKK